MRGTGWRHTSPRHSSRRCQRRCAPPRRTSCPPSCCARPGPPSVRSALRRSPSRGSPNLSPMARSSPRRRCVGSPAPRTRRQSTRAVTGHLVASVADGPRRSPTRRTRPSARGTPRRPAGPAHAGEPPRRTPAGAAGRVGGRWVAALPEDYAKTRAQVQSGTESLVKALSDAAAKVDVTFLDKRLFDIKVPKVETKEITQEVTVGMAIAGG